MCVPACVPVPRAQASCRAGTRSPPRAWRRREAAPAGWASRCVCCARCARGARAAAAGSARRDRERTPGAPRRGIASRPRGPARLLRQPLQISSCPHFSWRCVCPSSARALTAPAPRRCCGACMQMGGLSFLEYIRQLSKRVDSEWDAVRADLETIRQALLSRCANGRGGSGAGRGEERGNGGPCLRSQVCASGVLFTRGTEQAVLNSGNSGIACRGLHLFGHLGRAGAQLPGASPNVCLSIRACAWSQVGCAGQPDGRQQDARRLAALGGGVPRLAQKGAPSEGGREGGQLAKGGRDGKGAPSVQGAGCRALVPPAALSAVGAHRGLAARHPLCSHCAVLARRPACECLCALSALTCVCLCALRRCPLLCVGGAHSPRSRWRTGGRRCSRAPTRRSRCPRRCGAHSTGTARAQHGGCGSAGTRAARSTLMMCGCVAAFDGCAADVRGRSTTLPRVATCTRTQGTS